MYTAKNVVALWPKIDRPYRFDQGEQRSVSCGATEDGAAYELNFRIAKADAKELWAYIDGIWKDYLKANGKKPMKMMNPPFAEDKEDPSMLVFKTKLKAAYSGQPTKKPVVYAASNLPITDEDFQLTTGSTVNVAFQGIGYQTSMAAGVSLRLRAVQLLELGAVAAGASPFEVDQAAVEKSMANMAVYEQKPETTTISVESKAAPAGDVDFEDDIPF